LFATFTFAYLFYLSDIIKWEKPPVELHFWCVVAILMSVVSILLNNRKYQKIINEPSFITEEKMTFLKGNTQWLILLLMSIIVLFWKKK
jgi:tellurite resistance protein TehA-like permease